MTIDQALQAAAVISPGASYFTHLCHDVSHAALEAALPASRHVAHDGLNVTAGISR
jgi:phosphoribosyl 1,2-cyclic phosphate phosphodiesterase